MDEYTKRKRGKGFLNRFNPNAIIVLLVVGGMVAAALLLSQPFADTSIKVGKEVVQVVTTVVFPTENAVGVEIGIECKKSNKIRVGDTC